MYIYICPEYSVLYNERRQSRRKGKQRDTRENRQKVLRGQIGERKCKEKNNQEKIRENRQEGEEREKDKLRMGSSWSTRSNILLKTVGYCQLSCILNYALNKIHILLKRICSLFLSKYLFVERVFTITKKQQKISPALQKTRTASHYHFEIRGSWRSD